jgi:hypothetical protein
MRSWLLPLLLWPLAANAADCNDACLARKAEARLLKSGLAERHGNRLVLTTHAGKRTFTDDRQACIEDRLDTCAIYALTARPPGSLAVEKFVSEGGDSYLIDARSGRQTQLDGVPVFSPDGRRFVVAQFENETQNNLEVWRRDGDSAKLEWFHSFEQSFPEDPALNRYSANPALALPPVFRVVAWQGEGVSLTAGTDDQRYHWPARLSHDARGWHLSAKSPPGLLPQPGMSASP